MRGDCNGRVFSGAMALRLIRLPGLSRLSGLFG
jgi:hypothetical protein